MLCIESATTNKSLLLLEVYGKRSRYCNGCMGLGDREPCRDLSKEAGMEALTLAADQP